MNFNNISLRFGYHSVINNVSWHLPANTSFAILGSNACGKSSLARLITGELAPTSGQLLDLPKSTALVSLETQQALYELELYRDDSEHMDRLDEGSSVTMLLAEETDNAEDIEAIITLMRLDSLKDRGYRSLSSGESRRLLIAKALLSKPELLILDEPFEALDPLNRDHLHGIINELYEKGQAILLLANQQADIPQCFQQLALMHQGKFVYQGGRPDNLANSWSHLLAVQSDDIALPARQSQYQLADWASDKALLNLVDGFVQYDTTFQFRGFNWLLLPGQHTQIQGPNGCGKSTLLGLVTGDNPQCFRNNLTVFGYKRGQGESIWQIKKHLGLVSGAFHRDYRVGGNVIMTVVSGLTDSIGVYREVGEHEKHLAMQWLRLIGLQDRWKEPFDRLSMGEQRLVLIARALIKQPPLLVLDEPTQGLDDFNRFYVLSVIEKIIENGPTTVLFVSHRQDENLSFIKHGLVFVESEEVDCRYRVEAR